MAGGVDEAIVSYYLLTVMRIPRQLSFDERRYHTGRGGPRIGAGRPPLSKNPPVHHVKRPPVPRACPAHVTLRVRRGIPSLRQKRFLRELRPSLRKACERGEFRVAHYSVQGNHLHLIVEASDGRGLARGMNGLATRIARGLNRAWQRVGAVFADRYHARILEGPRAVRTALVYVLRNGSKHGSWSALAPDPFSSGPWFDGWRDPVAKRPDRRLPILTRARTWLLLIGWRRHGLLGPLEVPAAARARRA